MTIANYFVSEMKANPEKQVILVSFKRVPTAKEKKDFEAKRKLQKKNNIRVMQHMAQVFMVDPYGDPDTNYDLAFPTMFMVIKVREVQKRKLTIGSVVAFNVPEDSTDILKAVKINE